LFYIIFLNNVESFFMSRMFNSQVSFFAKQTIFEISLTIINKRNFLHRIR